eukprot:s1001_g9.t1
MKFGCMGDPVNLASRLEGLCKTYGVGILCSEVTKSQLPKEDGFVCRKLDLVQVKGKKEPTIIYEVIGRQPPRKAGASKPTSPVNLIPASPEPRSASADLLAFQPVPPTRIEQAQLYEQALQAYTQQQFSEATQLAAQLLEELGRLCHGKILFSQSYVDTSARESYRCDREIMYMLDMLMRPYPRRQILVTEDVQLAREANTVCHVRSAQWLNEELLKSGPAGVNASEALMSIEYDFQPIMEELPKAVQIAFAAR